MKKYIYLGYDIACIGAALIAALYLRHGLPLIQEGKAGDIYLLLGMTLLISAIVLPLMRTHTSIWRFTSGAELMDVCVAAALVILITNSSIFFITRLGMMPRSVPPLQWALAVLMMGGTRVLARKLLGPARGWGGVMVPKHHAIVVGACQTAELYLQFIRRITQQQMVIEGFVDSNPILKNRLFQKHKILGLPEDVPALIEELHVHGIHVRQVVLAVRFEELPASAQICLLELERAGTVQLVHFAKNIGPLQPRARPDVTDFYQNIGSLSQSDYQRPRGLYPYVKRLTDFLLALILLVLLSPLLLITALAVALDVGRPILFWQQRPGLYGKAFRLYKFRTMHHGKRGLSEERLAHKSSDGARTSLIGRVLRRLRMDELPQLVHILAGTMSFIGPRPLLPDDQPLEGEMRLSVRPGITGWAQVHGGDALSPQEKLAYDLYYIHHLSLRLDVRVLLRTLLVILLGDRRTQPLAAHTPRV